MCPVVLRHILQARSSDPLFLDTAGKGGRGVAAARLQTQYEAHILYHTSQQRTAHCFELLQCGLNRQLTQHKVVRILLPMCAEIKGIKL
jgi:hypothetical protein